jgi:hypothetical protein
MTSDTSFVIEDEMHAEWCGQFETFAKAVAELKARSLVAWDLPPNVCPCTSWRTCGRDYSIVEYDTATRPWKELRRTPIFGISSGGIRWEPGFTPPSEQ